MTELHPTSSGRGAALRALAGLGAAPQISTLLSPGGCKSSVLQGLLDSDLGARAASEPHCRPGGRVGAGGWGLLGPLGAWRSDQGVFGLEAGGAARAGADAGQHGDLCVAGRPVAAS